MVISYTAKEMQIGFCAPLLLVRTVSYERITLQMTLTGRNNMAASNSNSESEGRCLCYLISE